MSNYNILKTRTDLLKNLSQNYNFNTIIEIGVFEGLFSKEMLSILNPNKFYMVDIFDGVAKSGNKDGVDYKTIDLGKHFYELTNQYSGDGRVDVVKSYSADFIKSLEDESVDLIYIDGDHSYSGVKSDLENSYSKVKKGGFICGHDYTSPRFDGVVRAVDEFCNKMGLQINYLTQDGCPSYCIIK
jgi:hypothetical protein